MVDRKVTGPREGNDRQTPTDEYNFRSQQTTNGTLMFLGVAMPLGSRWKGGKDGRMRKGRVKEKGKERKGK